VVFVVMLGMSISIIWTSQGSSEESLVVATKTRCPDFESKPILYSKEAARICLNISEENVLQSVQDQIDTNMNRSIKARELVDGKKLFVPRHDKHLVHLTDSYDTRLPQQFRPPNRALEINITLENILDTRHDRVVQAALPMEGFPVEEFPVQFENFESSRTNCDNTLDSFAPVLWISSPKGISSTHYDRSMNLVVGIHGTKRWSLWHPRHNEKMGLAPWLSLRYQQIQHLNERFENSINLTLSRGEVLYVPPFWAHRVRSSDTHTVVALSVLHPSHVEERYSKAYFRVRFQRTHTQTCT